MSTRIRAHDWSASLIGDLPVWPQELKTVVGIMLHAHSPMAVYWGPELVLLYNDAWAELIGDKQHDALGRPAREVFPQIWEEIGPIMAGVLAGQGSAHADDQFLPLRRNGGTEQAWFSYEFDAIPLENGDVGGILNIAKETTGHLLAKRQRASERERLERMFAQAPGFMAMLEGPEHRFVLANRAYMKLVGHRSVLGKTVAEALPEVAQQGYLALLDRAYQTGEALASYGAKYAMQAEPGGSVDDRFIDFVFQPMTDAAGDVVGIFLEGTDVTERFAAEAALRESEQRLARVLDHVPVGVGMFDNSGRFTLKNPQMRDVIGELIPSRDEAGVRRWEAFDRDGKPVGEEDYPGARALAGEDASSPVDFRRVDGHGERWLRVSAVPMREGGAVVGGITVVQDVSEASRIQFQLRDSEARQSFRVELGDALRPLTRPEEIQAEAARLLCGHLHASHVHYAEVEPDDEHASVPQDHHTSGVPSRAGRYRLADFPGLIAECRSGRTFVTADVQADARLGEAEKAAYALLPAAAMVVMPLVKEGRLLALLAVHRDAAHAWSTSEIALIEETAERTWAAIERARAEARQRELYETLERRVAEALAERRLLMEVFDATGAFIQVVDRDYTLLAINKANVDEYERVYGLRPVAGDNLRDVLANFPEQRDAACAYFSLALAGETFAVTGEFGDSAREPRWYEITFSPLRGPGGELIGAYHFSLDVTARRREQERLREAEEQLRQSQKMDAMGQLTGGVAHDFNNLLSPIVGALDLLQRRGTGGERERRLVDGALQSAERARLLVQRLLAFARRQPLRPQAVDVGALVSGMARLVASTLGPQIKVVVNLADDLPAAVADSNQVEMAILNLAVNARDAMPDGGTLRISTQGETVGSGTRSQLQPGRYIRLSVADTGIGMDEATLRRAVEPFFSTKGVGRGTGLGLSMAHGLALQLGGALTIESKTGMGTNIEIWLPASDAGANAVTASGDHPGLTTAAGTVLLVDDEELVRASTADMLAEMGYAVVQAVSAEEALKLVEEGLAPDVLVTDYLMPGMNGNDLAHELRCRWPALPVLLVSGFADAESIAPDFARLVKPFRHTDLTARLRELDNGLSR